MKFRTKDIFSFTTHSALGSGLRAWLETLYRNKFKVHPFVIPKIIFISISVFLATPLRWYEKIKFKNKISDQKIKQPVFVIGHYRSGTTFLHYLLCKDPDFGYCTTVQAMIPHMFLTSGNLFSSIISKALPSMRPMDNLKMGESLPTEEEFALAGFGSESVANGYYFPMNYYTIFRKSILSGKKYLKAEMRWKKNFDYFLRKLSFVNNGKPLLLKSPANTGRINQILSLYPDAKFIHIYRNPADVFASYRHLFQKLLPILSFQQISDTDIEENIFRSYADLYSKYFEEKKLVPPGNLFEMSYEDFTADPVKKLEQIYQVLQLPGFENTKPLIEEELGYYRDYKKNEFVLSPEEKEKIYRRWKFAFDEFGYTKPS